VKINVLKLGTTCIDKATELEGTLTHWAIDMGQRIDYLFQPKGLDERGLPVNKLILEEERLGITENDFETVDVPFDIIGSIVASKASGYTGMAIGFVRHINGCFHVVIQPKGISQKSGTPIQKCEFDLRECTGDKIIELSEKDLAQSKKDTPSPADTVDQDLPLCVSQTLFQH